MFNILKTLIGIRLTLSTIFILVFTFAFNYTSHTVILHILFVLVIYSTTILTLHTIFFISKKKLTYVFALGVFLIDLTLILIYLAVTVSNKLWGGNITFNLITDYVKSALEIIQSLPWLGVVILIFLIFLIQLGKFYFKKNEFFIQQCLNLFELNKQKNIAAAFRKITYVISLLIAFIFLFKISFDREIPGIWNGEPISNLFLKFIPVVPESLENDTKELLNYQPSKNAAPSKNVIIIVADALRADHLDMYGYHRKTTPFLSSLYENNTLLKVDEVYATCPESMCGIMSTLSSRIFSNLSLNSIHLGDVLKAHGYSTHYYLTGGHEWHGLSKFYRADYFIDGVNRKNFAVNDDSGTLDSLKNAVISTDTPHFIYIHLYSTHVLGAKINQFNKFHPVNIFCVIDCLSETSSDKQTTSINKYDNGILQLDYFISKVFMIFSDKGLLKNSLVYITSDHGEGLGEHNHYNHVHYLYQEDLKIPLLIYDEGANQYKNLQYGNQTDLAPTIIKRLNFTLPESWEGVSYIDEEPGYRISYHQTIELNGWKAVLIKDDDNLFKYMFKGNRITKQFEQKLFDLRKDPNENNNLLLTNNDYSKIIDKIDFNNFRFDRSLY